MNRGKNTHGDLFWYSVMKHLKSTRGDEENTRQVIMEESGHQALFHIVVNVYSCTWASWVNQPHSTK